MTTPVKPFIKVKRDAPVLEKGGIILRAPLQEKSYNCTVVDVFEGSEVAEGERVAVPVGFFKPIPDEELMGLVDIENGMFTIVNP